MNVPRRHDHASRSHDSSDLAIRLRDGTPSGTTDGGYLRVEARCGAVERQNPSGKQTAECPFGGVGEIPAACTLGQNRDTGSNLGLRHRRHEHLPSRPTVHPGQNPRMRGIEHHFGHYIRIEYHHRGPSQSKRGGSRMGSRCGTSNSTPPKGLNNSWIAVPKPFVGTETGSTAMRRINRTSSSMERPLFAARTRNLVFTSSSRLRIVMLAMIMPPSVQCTIPGCLQCNQAWSRIGAVGATVANHHPVTPEALCRRPPRRISSSR